MRSVALSAIVAGLFAAPAFALMVTDVDTDGDGMVSYDEMMAMYPDLTEDAFNGVDTSGDGLVDEAELAAALESGMIEEPAE